MIRDQRHMQGTRQHATVRDVRGYWQTFAADYGFVKESGLRIRGGELVDDDRTLDAYVDSSRWVTDCPECGGGVACWPENPHGCCLDCGHVYKIRFPKGHAQACAVLSVRPKASTRNWHPHRGETIDHLKAENIARALPVIVEA